MTGKQLKNVVMENSTLKPEKVKMLNYILYSTLGNNKKHTITPNIDGWLINTDHSHNCYYYFSIICTYIVVTDQPNDMNRDM